MFREIFAHHQERETEIFTAYIHTYIHTYISIQTPIPKHNTTHPPVFITLIIITTYHIRSYITFCISIFAGYHMLYKPQSHAPDDGQKIARNMLS